MRKLRVIQNDKLLKYGKDHSTRPRPTDPEHALAEVKNPTTYVRDYMRKPFNIATVVSWLLCHCWFVWDWILCFPRHLRSALWGVVKEMRAMFSGPKIEQEEVFDETEDDQA